MYIYVYIRSTDLNTCDFFLWGYMKEEVHRVRPGRIAEVKQLIREFLASIDEGLLQRVTSISMSRVRRCFAAMEETLSWCVKHVKKQFFHFQMRPVSLTCLFVYVNYLLFLLIISDFPIRNRLVRQFWKMRQICCWLSCEETTNFPPRLNLFLTKTFTIQAQFLWASRTLHISWNPFLF